MKATERTNMRRKDRARGDEWIKEMVTRAGYCTVATTDGDQPYITMVTFVYDPKEHALYFHTSKSGRIYANTVKGTKVCISVSEMGRLLPARTARNMSVEYRSATVFGRISIVEDLEAGTAMMQKLVDKYFPHLQPERNYRPISPPEIEEIAVYRVDIEEWSGKQKSADADAEGAFLWENVGAMIGQVDKG